MKENKLCIIIGGDFEKDFDTLLNGKIDFKKHPKNVIYLDSFKQLNELLSPSKLDLFNYLIDYQDQEKPMPLTKISIELKRKKEAISRDVKQLNNLELISLKKIKQSVYAFPKYKAIEIKTMN
jgi:predicted transcriptional regulator